jgi:hypothetical protein
VDAYIVTVDDIMRALEPAVKNWWHSNRTAAGRTDTYCRYSNTPPLQRSLCLFGVDFFPVLIYTWNCVDVPALALSADFCKFELEYAIDRAILDL